MLKAFKDKNYQVLILGSHPDLVWLPAKKLAAEEFLFFLKMKRKLIVQFH